MRILLLLFVAIVSLAFSGCASSSVAFPYDSASQLLLANYRAVEQMLAVVPPLKSLNKSQPILVASLVNIDDLTSSRFGKTVSEQVATKLTKSGYTVIEVKLRNAIFVKQPDGEFMLSREVKEISQNHNAQAVVVGTYSETLGSVYVTIKVVGLSDSLTIAAHDYLLNKDANIRYMLHSSLRN
jgi:TolB-like protein